MSRLLEIRDLSVALPLPLGMLHAVRGVDLTLDRGQSIGIVGESGSGKSMTALALMRLLPRGAVSTSEKLEFDGMDLASMAETAFTRQIAGPRIGMIFQEPMTSLNPVRTIGDQIAEAIGFHRPVSRRQALNDAAELLSLVGIPEARRRLSSYPHHLSGGMRQRVMIAMAISCEPRVIIADEPTTALDVTVQAQILELLKSLQKQTGMAMIFITHNLGVVAEVADRVMVMYAGRLVEEAPVGALFARPLMPYTSALLKSVPRMDTAGRRDVALEAIPGTVPDPSHQPPGCAFHTRCRFHQPGLCDGSIPPVSEAAEGHRLRCLRWREIGGRT